MTPRRKVACLLPALLVLAGIGAAQFWNDYGDSGRRVHVTEGGVRVDEDSMTTARDVASHSTEVPMWTNAPGFEKDSFSFCRIAYTSAPFSRERRSRGTWITDFPDSDLNLSFRLQQMTALKVNPNGRFLRLKNRSLTDYPWIYMVEPGRLALDDEEVAILRKYLLNGGFLMADDFWGEVQWQNFAEQIKKVLPERDFVELEMDHPVFHAVFDITVPKQRLQTPNVRQAIWSLMPNSGYYGVTWEPQNGEGSEEMHVRAILDDKGRIMVIATHNCDNGDGWEREGENDDFFRAFSETRAFPLGINIIFYAMTH